MPSYFDGVFCKCEKKRKMKNIALTLLLVFAAVVLAEPQRNLKTQNQGSQPEKSTDRPGGQKLQNKISRLELETKYHLLESELKKKDEKIKMDERIERIREIANKLIKQASAETDPAAR